MKNVILFSIILFGNIFAGEIKGRVTNIDSGESLEYVRVFLKGSDLNSITDSNGYFIICGVPDGEYILSVATVLHEKYEKVYEFNSSGNNYDIEIKLKKVVPYIPRDSLIEDYHAKLLAMPIDDILKIDIDSCKIIYSGILTYSTFTNYSDYPIYMIKNFEFLTSVRVNVFIDGNMLATPPKIYTDTIGMKTLPDSSDIIVINPHSSIKYSPLISFVNVCDSSKKKYEVSLTYDYNRPDIISGPRFLSGAEAFYNAYNEEFYCFNIAFRRKVESTNKVLVECEQ